MISYEQYNKVMRTLQNDLGWHYSHNSEYRLSNGQSIKPLVEMRKNVIFLYSRSIVAAQIRPLLEMANATLNQKIRIFGLEKGFHIGLFPSFTKIHVASMFDGKFYARMVGYGELRSCIPSAVFGINEHMGFTPETKLLWQIQCQHVIDSCTNFYATRFKF